MRFQRIHQSYSTDKCTDFSALKASQTIGWLGLCPGAPIPDKNVEIANPTNFESNQLNKDIPYPAASDWRRICGYSKTQQDEEDQNWDLDYADEKEYDGVTDIYEHNLEEYEEGVETKRSRLLPRLSMRNAAKFFRYTRLGGQSIIKNVDDLADWYITHNSFLKLGKQPYLAKVGKLDKMHIYHQLTSSHSIYHGRLTFVN
ncbi:unnamed protein product [Protopolystoma xenopodis]|uniref:Uncharacterized protein n=1 Tax=Protopolystoma xenopodis TaxID=117903 RepID=A0A3S5CU34_9PLAT|nr:unnamed protein product [Protopolystoma xenopodis]